MAKPKKLAVNRRGFLKGAATAAAGAGAAAVATTTPTTGATAPVTITIRSQNGNQSFSPNPASAGGQQVVFRNADTITHRVVLNDGGIDTGDIAPGATSAVMTMPAAGVTYHCLLHPSMVGAVTSATGGAPPPCTVNCGGNGDVPPTYY
jgi:plastocyanin